jgi:hypothetical protein
MSLESVDPTKLFSLFFEAVKQLLCKDDEIIISRRATTQDLHDVWNNDELILEQVDNTIKISSKTRNGKILTIESILDDQDMQFIHAFYARCKSIRSRVTIARGYCIAWGTHSKEARTHFSDIADVIELRGKFMIKGNVHDGSGFSTFSDKQVIRQMFEMPQYKELKRACAVNAVYPNNTAMMYGKFKISPEWRYKRNQNSRHYVAMGDIPSTYLASAR